MNKIISSQNLSTINSAINEISFKLGVKDLSKVVWNACGSYVINTQTKNSDLDLMAISDIFTKPELHVFKHFEIPVHLTTVPPRSFLDDGRKRLYGAYFSGKIINPHILFGTNENFKNKLIISAGNFIGPLAGYLGSTTKNNIFNKEQLTAQVFVTYLSTDPSFDSYFLSYYVSPDFNHIWEALCDTTINMLLVAKTISSAGSGYKYINGITDYKEFHIERMKCSARHWSFGAVIHGSNYKFQDTIYENARSKMLRIDPTNNKYAQMVKFLREKSGLKEIFI